MQQKKLIDSFGRQMDYVRLAVTDRCNLRCQYCMPAHGIEIAPRADLLTFKEMYRIIRVLTELGVNKIRLTGGEPFVRKDFVGFLEMLSFNDLLEAINITTNGAMILKHIPTLEKMDKIKLDEVKSSSRLKPSLSFDPGKTMYRSALILEEFGHGFDGETLFQNGDLILEAGAKLAIIGENGVGKTTMLRCLVNELKQNHGVIKWSENASVGYCPQDSSADFDNDLSIFDWISQWRTTKHDDLAVRGILGRLLFTADDANKKARNCSGGEKNRLLFGKLMMQDINVLVMDEPTNHMDMEAIEALNNALKVYEGTLIFVSHDREFVSSLATRIIDINDKQVIDFQGTFDEYMSNLALTQDVA